MLDFKKAVFANGGFRLSADWTLSDQTPLAVIGPSGSGKSTLLSGIAGFVPLESGEIQWQDKTLHGTPDMRPVSMLFQSHNLFPHLNVQQNVGLGLRPTLNLSPDDLTKVAKALIAVGLGNLAERKPNALSGGQQSRVALARVMVRAKPIILLDEPFSALGPAQRREMLDLVKDVSTQMNALLIMVTHDPDEALQLGGLATYVDDGAAHAPMEVQALFKTPPAGLKAYLG